jgi:hypothetical protein
MIAGIPEIKQEEAQYEKEDGRCMGFIVLAGIYVLGCICGGLLMWLIYR